jgi:hypothetical protein
VGLFARRKKADDEPIGPDERSPQLGLKYKDLVLLGQLIDQGADLGRARHVVHFSYFPSESSASAAAVDLGAEGWTPDVRPPRPESPDQWALVCERDDAVLSADFVRESTDLFESVALRHGGEHDGWEAAV